ncbi:MAG: GNAT family N-acetyltransferase [Bergeyella sp.]|nr:GNAT family N-acetyltransferase [Bergeyella sp.]
MNKIIIKEVRSKKELSDFIKYPLRLYRDNPYYVPPIIEGEKSTWNRKKNPAFYYSDFRLFLALRDQKIVGRVAAILNRKEAEELGVKKVRFGWFDFIDDLEVSKALIESVITYAGENAIDRIEGPMGITNLDKAGMLTLGFDQLATMVGLYNFPYYVEHMERMGFEEEKKWVEYKIKFPEKLPEKVLKFNDVILKKYGLNLIKFRRKKDILSYVSPIFKLLDVTYRELSTYTPITKEQIHAYKKKYFGFVDKEYIVCIENKVQELVAFAITMPSYSRALQKSGGKIFPFGWLHFLRARKINDTANFYLIGVHPDYQKKGITSIIFKEIYKVFKKKGIKFLETNPELEENKEIQLLWQQYDATLHKKRATYSLDIKKEKMA